MSKVTGFIGELRRGAVYLVKLINQQPHDVILKLAGNLRKVSEDVGCRFVLMNYDMELVDPSEYDASASKVAANIALDAATAGHLVKEAKHE